MSGGYGLKDFPRSTWDGCCKLPIGNAYMLEEIGERFRGASYETYSKLSVFSLHTYGRYNLVFSRFLQFRCLSLAFIDKRIELWRMHVASRGVLQYERTHRATVPICFEEERKCLFDFVVVLWDLRVMFFFDEFNLFSIILSTYFLFHYQCWLFEVTNVINKLLKEHNDSGLNVSNLSSDILPPHPFTPQKNVHKKGIITTYPKSEPNSSLIRSEK